MCVQLRRSSGAFLDSVDCGAQSEVERFARNAFDVRPNGPTKTSRNCPRERDGLNLQVETTITLLVAPVGVQPPEEAMFFAGRKREVGFGIKLGDASALRDAVAVIRVKAAEGNVISRIHEHGDDVALADAHAGESVSILLRDEIGLQDFGREVLRVSIEVGEQALEVGGSGAGSEGGTAPVMQECAGGFGVSWDEVFEDDFAAAEASEGLGIR